MFVVAPPKELGDVGKTYPQVEIRPKDKGIKKPTIGDIPDDVLVDETNNGNNNADGSSTREKEQFDSDRYPIQYKIMRGSQNPYNSNNQQYPPHPERSPPPMLIRYSQPGLNPIDEERCRTCVVLISSWLFLVISVFFLICYGYQLEWSPETADPIQVFSLDFGINMIYIMFIVDVFASIGIILSYKNHVKPFRWRVYWSAVVFLILNQIHGTFIWLWVWTGEFPRTCSRNSFYLGRRCENLALLMTVNPNGNLRLADCKCDYGSCLPECKGLRLIQNYFWGTYWLYICRMAVLIILIPKLNAIVCQCKWCCCLELRVLPAMGPVSAPETVVSYDYNDTNERSRNNRGTSDGHANTQTRDKRQSNPDQCPDFDHRHSSQEQYEQHCNNNPRRSNDSDPPCCQEEAAEIITRKDNQCPLTYTYHRDEVTDKTKARDSGGSTMIRCNRHHIHHHHRHSNVPDPHHEQQFVANCPIRANSPTRNAVLPKYKDSS